MKRYLFHNLLWCLILLCLQACNTAEKHAVHHPQENQTTAKRVTDVIAEAADPYFTYDAEGNPVLCWTEKLNSKEEYILKFAIFQSQKNEFSEAIEVLPSRGTRAHPESMNKIAFKKDGTIIAVYAIKHATEENRFAGSIMYTLSRDQGKTWSSPAYLHSNTLPMYSRSFFDVATMPDGEVGAVWLDGRFAATDTGSALFYAKTEPGNGFGQDQQIGESTCECCRTDIYVDAKSQIHIAYRDIMASPAAIGAQVRDIAHIVSTDGGRTFSQAKSISADHWHIDGCPHTGPSLAANQEGLHAVWFTAGGQPGLYYTHAKAAQQSFDTRQLISPQGRHPQMLTLSDDQTAIVYEEVSKETGTHLASSHASGHDQHSGENNTSLKLQLRSKNKTDTFMITDGTQIASYPIIAKIYHQLLIAWVQRENERTGIYYTLKPVEP